VKKLLPLLPHDNVVAAAAEEDGRGRGKVGRAESLWGKRF